MAIAWASPKTMSSGRVKFSDTTNWRLSEVKTKNILLQHLSWYKSTFPSWMTKGSPNSNSWAQQSTEAAFMTAVSLLQLLLMVVEGFGSVELFIRSREMFEPGGLQSLNTLLSPFLLLSIGLAPPADGGTLLKVLRHRNSLPTTRSSLSSPLSLSLYGQQNQTK